MSSKLSAVVLGIACAATSCAQLAPGPTRIYGTTDKDLPTPTHSAKTQSDEGAIQVLSDLVRATGALEWKGMTATGTIMFPGDSGSHAAKLSVLNGSLYRLDVTRDAGIDSTIFNGSQALFIRADGVRKPISSDVAALGLISLLRLLASGYPASSTILTDQGIITVATATLHRVTLDDPSVDGTGNPWKTIDLYSDPKTGHLIESVATVHISTADRSLYTLDTIYADYRTAGLLQLPYTYTQNLNGQLQWTLTLNNINMSMLPDVSVFNF